MAEWHGEDGDLMCRVAGSNPSKNTKSKDDSV
jgi:hypothetical protein